MKLLLKLIFFFLLISYNPVYSQKPDIDSLKRVIETAPDDTNKVIAYRMLCGTLSNSDPRSGIPYGRKGVELAKKLKWDKGIAGSYLNLGGNYQNLAIYDSAIMFTDSALIYSLKAGEPGRIALVYINRAAALIYLGNLEQAMTDALKALPYAKESQNQDRIARVYMTMGNISFYQEDWNKAIEFYDHCLPLFAEAGVSNMVGTCFMNTSTCYKNLNEFEKALNYNSQAIQLFVEDDDNERLTIAYGNRGEMFKHLRQFDEAEQNFKLAIDLSLKMNDIEQLISSQHSIGELYYLEKRYDDAKGILIPSLDSARKYNYYAQIFDLTNTLSLMYVDLGDYQQAYKYLTEYNAAKDTLNERERTDKLLQLQTQFETDQNLQEIALLNSESELKDARLARKNLTNYLLIGAVLSILIITTIIFNRNKLRNQLKEVQLRSKIASDLHDDIGATLSSIKMYSEIVQEQIKTTHPKSVPVMARISESSKEMIDSMSDIVWMIKPGHDTFNNLQERMINFAYEMCSVKQIDLQVHSDEKLNSVILPMEMRRDIYLIFKEAINNAVKYSKCDTIDLEIYGEKESIHLTIRDNGTGFDVNAQSQTKNGNGIENMRQRAVSHRGTFAMESTKGKGTTITISVPIP